MRVNQTVPIQLGTLAAIAAFCCSFCLNFINNSKLLISAVSGIGIVTPTIPSGLVGSGTTPIFAADNKETLSFAFVNLKLGNPRADKSVKSKSTIRSPFSPSTALSVLNATSSAEIKPNACAAAKPPL